MASKGIYQYTVQESQNAGLGQVGSVFLDGAAAAGAFTPSKGVVVAITVITEAKFDALTAAEENKYASTAVGYEGLGDTISTGTTGDSFPTGITIFGRWSSVDVNDGAVICYIG